MVEWGSEIGKIGEGTGVGHIIDLQGDQRRRIESVEAFQREPIAKQLEKFLTTAKYLDRRLLSTPELDVYVRRNRRDIGRPVVSNYEKEGGIWTERRPGLLPVDCLDIADIVSKRTTFKIGENGSPIETGESDIIGPWETFIGQVDTSIPEGIKAIYADNLGDPRIEKWMEERRDWWEYTTSEPGRARSFFKWTHKPLTSGDNKSLPSDK